MKLLLSLAAVRLALAVAAPALGPLASRQVGPDSTDDRPTNYIVYSFDQLIDHFPDSSHYEPHTNAIFSQEYVFDDTYYKLTTEQTIADNAYFAQHVKLANVSDGDNLTTAERPWILYGGSLAGPRTAFSLVTYKNMLWGGIASSGVVKVVLAQPEWYYPIQNFLWYSRTILANYTNGEAWTGLGGYAEYVKNVVVSKCPSEDLIDTTEYFSTQNATFYGLTDNTAARSYLYTTCTEAGNYQTAPWDPEQPSLVSRVLKVDYTQQWCTWAFGDAVPPDGPNLTYYEKYGGFNISAPRLALIDGAQDVWNEVCYHGSNSTKAHNSLIYGDNQLLITGAGHHWDSYGILNIFAEPDFVRAAHEWEIRKVVGWIREWNEVHGSSVSLKDEL